MCTVSMIGDHYHDKWRYSPWYSRTDTTAPIAREYYPDTPFTKPVPVAPPIGTITTFDLTSIPRTEFDALKKEVEDMKALLIRAKAYDEQNGEPDCEMADKVAILRAVAKAVGVSLDDVLSNDGG